MIDFIFWTLIIIMLTILLFIVLPVYIYYKYTQLDEWLTKTFGWHEPLSVISGFVVGIGTIILMAWSWR